MAGRAGHQDVDDVFGGLLGGNLRLGDGLHGTRGHQEVAADGRGHVPEKHAPPQLRAAPKWSALDLAPIESKTVFHVLPLLPLADARGSVCPTALLVIL